MDTVPEITVRDVVETRTEIKVALDDVELYFNANQNEQAIPVAFRPTDFPLSEAQIDTRIHRKSELLGGYKYQAKANMIAARTVAAVLIGLGGVGAGIEIAHEDKGDFPAIGLFVMGIAAGGLVEFTGRNGNKSWDKSILRTETEIRALNGVKEYLVPVEQDDAITEGLE